MTSEIIIKTNIRENLKCCNNYEFLKLKFRTLAPRWTVGLCVVYKMGVGLKWGEGGKADPRIFILQGGGRKMGLGGEGHRARP